jgi:hypothetical protein
VLPGDYVLEGFILVYPPGGQVKEGSSIPFGPDGLPLRRLVQRWAKAAVHVTSEDIADLSIPLLEPFFVTGRVVFVRAGSTDPPQPVQAGFRIYLSKRTGQQASFPTASTRSDGTFSLGPAFPDKYELSIDLRPETRVVSIIVNGRDIANQVIDLDRDLKDVVITFTNVR